MNQRQEQKRVHGRVTTDPAANLQDGATIDFQPVGVKLLRSDDETVFMDNLGAFNGVVLSFHFANDTGHDVDGSAGLVAPVVALTAKHVIEPHWDRLIKGERHSMCIGIAKSGMSV